MKLLLVENSPGDAMRLRGILDGSLQADLVCADSLAGALAALGDQSFDALLLDLELHGSEAPEQILARILAASGGVSVVVLIGEENERLGMRAVQAGAQDYLVKHAFDSSFLRRTLHHAVERQRLLSRLAGEIALREEAQEALEEVNDALADRVRKRTRELQHVNRSLSLLSQCNRSMLRARDEQTLLDEVCRLVVDSGGYLMAWVGYAQEDADRTLKHVASAGGDPGCIQALQLSWAEGERGQTPFGAAVRTGRAAIERDLSARGGSIPWRDAAIKCGAQALVAMPLRVENRVVGMLSICSEAAAVFEEPELQLLEELVADLSFGIETLRGRTALREAEAKARLLSSAIEQTADLVTISDCDGNILYVNAAFEQVTGYSFDEAVGRNVSMLNSGILTAEHHERLWQTIESGRAFHGTFINRHKDGSLYYEQKTITPIIEDEQGRVAHYLSTGKDITKEVVFEDRLRQLSLHDPLTELPNRGHIRNKIEQMIESVGSAGRVAAVLVLNLDRFRVINHSLGHEGGDALLQAVAHRLLESARPGDTVARLEADNFALLLDDINTVGAVASVVNSLLDTFAEPFSIGGDEVFVTLSMGVSVWPGDAGTAAGLLQNAEVALSRAKQLGRARCEYYEPAMNTQAAKRLSIETSLRRALERQEFVLHYQPKFDLRNGRIVGAEALVRWRHPERGLVPPGDFIPLLEETGLVVPVGRWVLESACIQHRAWAAQGGESLVMAVNLSAQQFAQDDLVQMVEESLRSCDFEGMADWLELEITESAVMQDVGHTAATLQRLKDMGIRVAIDDFGTGHSSLSYLTRLPIDVLKIDRTFVLPLPHSQQDAEVVRAIIALARSLGLEVVAEGVETAEQQAFLLEQGCTLAQGYHFARPLPANQVMPLFSQRGWPAGKARLEPGPGEWN